MSREAIEQVREAESQAEVLCRVAEEKAAEMRHSVKEKGRLHCEEEERATRAEYAAKLDEIKRRAAALTARRRAEAEAEAKALSEAAEARMEEAVKLIVWGIIEKCQ